ncbi:MAG: ATP-binding protein [Bacteroidota bacterium]
MRELIIPSRHAELERVLTFVEAYVADHELGDDMLDRLMLLGSEAATNAMEHGNQYNEAKAVRLKLWKEGDRVVMTVQDEGDGFVPEDEANNPLTPENLLEDHGRGLFLMREMATALEYEDDGRRVRMEFAV